MQQPTQNRLRHAPASHIPKPKFHNLLFPVTPHYFSPLRFPAYYPMSLPFPYPPPLMSLPTIPPEDYPPPPSQPTPSPYHTPNGNRPVCVEEKSTLQSRNPNNLTIIVQERAPATHTICNQFSPIGVRPRSEKNNSELTNPILVRISNRKTNHSKSLIKIGHQRGNRRTVAI